MNAVIKAHHGRWLRISLGTLAFLLLFAAQPAKADGFAIGVGPEGGINFSYSSGGYCDARGCPRDFWDLPVYYCPVYHHGRWYRGPLYYRHGRFGLQFWIRGKWRYDHWRGPRPRWACTDRMGPPLGYRYYERHGFRMKPQWHQRWRKQHPHHSGDMQPPNTHRTDRHRPDMHGPRDLRHAPRGDARRNRTQLEKQRDRRDIRAGKKDNRKAAAETPKSKNKADKKDRKRKESDRDRRKDGT